MDKNELLQLLESVASKKIAPDEALLKIKTEPYKDLGFAKVDTQRRLRQGVAEVIYGAGKTAEQIIEIANNIEDSAVLITRVDEEKADKLLDAFANQKCEYDKVSKTFIVGEKPAPKNKGKIAVITAGTSDIPVAEEAAITAEVFGNEVVRIYDVGVAGLHRLLDKVDEIMSAEVIIAIAGMEGALASVVGGLVDVPVIAVPTSVGYGANFEGLSALLSMLNSCASGVSVVNIDNGFGAGFLANRINSR